MQIQKSIFIKDVREVIPTKVGKFFLFDDYLCVEIDEGVHLTHEKVAPTLDYINEFYKGKKNLIYVVNRVNNYSIEALEYPKFFKSLPIIDTFCIVYYNTFNSYNIDIEKRFTDVNFVSFKNLREALKFCSKRYKKLLKKAEKIKIS